MTTVLLDTHVLQWWSAKSGRLSGPASAAVEDADELAVTWYWLVRYGRISVSLPIGTWLGVLARSVRTAALTPAIAATAFAPAPNLS